MVMEIFIINTFQISIITYLYEQINCTPLNY